jgi:hypothetical protein
MSKTIFYCSETQPINDSFRCYIAVKDRLVREFERKTGYQLFRLEKPEIYKHPAAFHFLEGFKPKALHLIIRKPGNIRLLKDAFNVLILPEVITETEIMRTPDNPFENLKRMFSLVDGIWTTRQENLECLKEADIKSVKYFKDEISLCEKIAVSA